MKIFEVTALSESPELAAQIAQKILARHKQLTGASQTAPSGTPSGKLDGKDGANQAASSGTPSGKLDGKDGARGADAVDSEFDADQAVRDAAAKIRSGEAQLSKDIDAELGKRGADPQDIHIQIMRKVQDAASSLASQIGQQGNLRPQQMRMLRNTTDMDVQTAAFGYINKKYLNGSDFSDGNFNFQTLRLITKALKSQAPKGGNQPIGKVSSSRAPGAQGTVSSGGGTNALDTIAAQDDW